MDITEILKLLPHKDYRLMPQYSAGYQAAIRDVENVLKQAAQQSVQRIRCTCRRNFEGAIIKVDPNCPLVQAAHR